MITRQLPTLSVCQAILKHAGYPHCGCTPQKMKSSLIMNKDHYDKLSLALSGNFISNHYQV